MPNPLAPRERHKLADIIILEPVVYEDRVDGERVAVCSCGFKASPGPLWATAAYWEAHAVEARAEDAHERQLRNTRRRVQAFRKRAREA